MSKTKPIELPDVKGKSVPKAARANAKAGIPIFPMSADGKRPVPASVGKRWGFTNGHLSATTDLERIKGFWAKYPEANIASAPGSWGCIGFDCDSQADVDAVYMFLDENGIDAGGTLRVRSGRAGTGEHIYLRNTTKLYVGSPHAKLGDQTVIVRGSGGYLVLPGSAHKSGRTYAVVDGYEILTAPRALIKRVSSKAPTMTDIEVGEAQAYIASLDLDEYDDDGEAFVADAVAEILDADDRFPVMRDRQWALFQGATKDGLRVDIHDAHDRLLTAFLEVTA